VKSGRKGWETGWKRELPSPGASAHQLHIHGKSFIFGTLLPPHFPAPLTCRQVSDESYLVIDMPVEWRSAKFWAAGGGKGHIPSYVHLLLGFVIELPDAWLGFLAYSNLIEGFCR